MDEIQLRSRWADGASVAFVAVIAVLILGGLGYWAYTTLTSGPSSEEVFFSQTLPKWWIARSKGETPEVDVFAALPAPSMEAPLRRIDARFGSDARDVAGETVALNQAIEEAGLPFFVDVVVKGEWPLLLTYRTERRDRWKQGDRTRVVVIAERIDRSNVVTQYTGRTGLHLPVVLLDQAEASILHVLQESSEDPVRQLILDRWMAAAQAHVEGFDPAAARRAAQDREAAIAKVERRRNLRVRRPRRFELPPDWLAHMHDLEREGVLYSVDLDAIESAERALNSDVVAPGLEFVRHQWSEVESAHQFHVAMAPDLSDAEPPQELVYVYGDEATPYRAGGHVHMRAALGAIRDAQAPPCFAVLRTLEGGAGPNRRRTAYYYGTLSALMALFDTRQWEPEVLAERARAACSEDEAALRDKAAAVLERLGVPPSEKVGPPSDRAAAEDFPFSAISSER